MCLSVASLHPLVHPKGYSFIDNHILLFETYSSFVVLKKKNLFETEPVSHSRKRKGYQEFPWQSVDGTKLGRKPLQNAK